MSIAAIKGSASSLGVLAAAAVLCAACGGTTEDPRDELSERPAKSGATTTKLSFSTNTCVDAVERYEFLTLETFDSTSTFAEGDRQNVALGWWISDDGTNPNRSPRPPPGTMVTDPGAKDPLVSAEGGAPNLVDCEDSSRSMLLQSSAPGFGEWGYTLGANPLLVGATGEYPAADASEFADGGLAVWVKGVGKEIHQTDGATNGVSLYASLPDAFTDDGDFCNEQLLDALQCDPYGRGISALPEWRLVLLPFADMMQRGFGRPSELDGPNLEEIMRMQFNVGAGVWDVWLDEISYYRPRDDKDED